MEHNEIENIFNKYDTMLRHEILHPEEVSQAEQTYNLELTEEELGEIIKRYSSKGNIAFATIASQQNFHKHPNSTTSLSLYCDMLIADNQIAKAEDVLEQFIQENKWDPITIFYLARIAIYKGRIEESKEYAEQLLENSEEKWSLCSPFYTLSHDCIKRKYYESAIWYLDISLNMLAQWEREHIDEKFVKELLSNIYYSYSFCYRKVNRIKESVAYLTKLLDINPFEAEIWMNLGYSYELLNENKRAQDAYENAYAIDNKFSKALLNLGMLYLKENQFEYTIKYAEAYLEKNNNDLEAMHLLCCAYLAIQEIKQAEFIAHKALILFPEDKLNNELIVLIEKIKKMEEDICYNGENRTNSNVEQSNSDIEQSLERVINLMSNTTITADQWDNWREKSK